MPHAVTTLGAEGAPSRVATADDCTWEVWNDERGHLRWCLLVDGADTAPDVVTSGVMVLDIGGRLAPHRHSAPEMYYVHEGEAIVDVGGEEVSVGPGAVVHLPGDVEHGVRAAGTGPVRILFVFPTSAFGDVVYRFSS
ncbi:cupin domain-containing protein [Actinomycetospora straminea]|uniref:Cupin type-2 domain-containing protein n=1 Tax=Actinomycetospora straminea TaxID=663607 RepID=A0ABP9F2V9_9PSEU|nr:cupin domain-containing protein [Actinomycetospora straminea]MDD7936147.1 cupin domain-containing protein [Actinomycetospora straminea]